MISKQRALFYFVGDTPFKDLREAQKRDLLTLIESDRIAVSDDSAEMHYDRIVEWMLKHASEVVDTLTTTPTSRMKARKLHGGTKKHKPKVQAVPIEQK